MTTLLDAARKALDALEVTARQPVGARTIEAILALRQAIEQAEQQEPFGYFQLDLRLDAWVQNRDSKKGVAFYTAPPQRKPLTDEEIALIVGECAASAHRHDDFSFARAIERAHGIGGGE